MLIQILHTFGNSREVPVFFYLTLYNTVLMDIKIRFGSHKCSTQNEKFLPFFANYRFAAEAHSIEKIFCDFERLLNQVFY